MNSDPCAKTLERVRDQVLGDNGIEKIWRILGSEFETALLIANRHTPASGWVPVHFPDCIYVEIALSEIELIQNSRFPEMPEGWSIDVDNVLFDGDLVYDDINIMLEDVRQFEYLVNTDDRPLKRQIGFCCVGANRAWHIRLTDLKNTADTGTMTRFASKESKEELLLELNTKPPWSCVKGDQAYTDTFG